jgi:hypothetical protein
VLLKISTTRTRSSERSCRTVQATAMTPLSGEGSFLALAAQFRNQPPLALARRFGDLWKRQWVLASYVWTACGRARGRKGVCRSLRRSSHAADGCGTSMGVRSIQALRESPPLPRLEALLSRFTAPQSVAGESTNGRLRLGAAVHLPSDALPWRFASSWQEKAAKAAFPFDSLSRPRGPYGIRTRAAAVRGRCPRPLDEWAP